MDKISDDNPHCGDIILIHGFAASLGTWYFTVAPALVQIGRVTMLDLRGHGRSSMPSSGYKLSDFVSDLDRLLNHLGIQKAHFLGHSLGGAIATAYVQKYPERTLSLILADVRLKCFQPLVQSQDLTLWLQNEKLFEQEFGITLNPNSQDQSYDFLIKFISARLHVPNVQFSKILQKRAFTGLAAFAKLSPRAAQKVLQLVNTTKFLQDLKSDCALPVTTLKSMNIPTLAIYGKNSHTLPTARALQELWPHLKMIFVPDAGHFFPVAQPATVIEPANAFIQANRAPI